MPTNWAWWAGVVGEDNYDLACEISTREDAIREGLSNTVDGEIVQIIEAQQSTAAKYEGADHVPFTRTRNHEVIGPKGPREKP